MVLIIYLGAATQNEKCHIIKTKWIISHPSLNDDFIELDKCRWKFKESNTISDNWGLAWRTNHTSGSGDRRFIRFCLMHCLVHDSGDILPASEGTLIYFASYLARSVCHSTIRLYLPAARNLHISCGHCNPLVENYSWGKYSGASFVTKGTYGFCVNQLLLGFSLLYVLFSAPGWVALTSPWCGPPSHLHFLAFSSVANSHVRVFTSSVPDLI